MIVVGETIISPLASLLPLSQSADTNPQRPRIETGIPCSGIPCWEPERPVDGAGAADELGRLPAGLASLLALPSSGALRLQPAKVSNMIAIIEKQRMGSPGSVVDCDCNVIEDTSFPITMPMRLVLFSFVCHVLTIKSVICFLRTSACSALNVHKPIRYCWKVMGSGTIRAPSSYGTERSHEDSEPVLTNYHIS